MRLLNTLSSLRLPKRLGGVCLCMIVKNESKVIANCLKSVRPLIDSWVIVDTGSTDQTKEIIQTVFHDLPGKLYDRPWINFGFNRTEAFQLTKHLEPRPSYILLIDADEICNAYILGGNPEKDLYFNQVYLVGEDMPFWRPFLLKASIDFFWVGRIHEVLCSNQEITSGVVDAPVNSFGNGSRHAIPGWKEKDIEMIKQDIVDHPCDTRCLFHLAMMLDKYGHANQAIEAYNILVSLECDEPSRIYATKRLRILNERKNLPQLSVFCG